MGKAIQNATACDPLPIDEVSVGDHFHIAPSVQCNHMHGEHCMLTTILGLWYKHMQLIERSNLIKGLCSYLWHYESYTYI